MEHEQLQDFNDRLNHWVAKQGFWFQLRYSLADTGTKGRAMFHLLKLASRVAVFLLVVAIGTWVYLLKRPDSEMFQDQMKEGFKAGLSATEVQMKGFNRANGMMEISRLAADGGEGTFFSTMEARNIRAKMSLVDGLVGKWEPGNISIFRLDMDLRAGTDDAASAENLKNAVFRDWEGMDLQTFTVADATIRWGFSDRTRGGIESSLLKVQKVGEGWRVSFEGGEFNQNWLRRLRIVKLTALCTPEGITFETARMKQIGTDGTVDFSGLKLLAGARPDLRGEVKLRRLDIGRIVPTALRSFVEGTMSGDFQVFGSTNSPSGVGFNGDVILDGEDVISLRERIHLLKALSIIDFSRNYHRVDFDEGVFSLKTIDGGLELRGLDLKAGELVTLKGELEVRQPTQNEVRQAVAKGSGSESSPLFAIEEEAMAYGEDDDDDEGMEMSLKSAALATKRIQEGQGQGSQSLFDRLSTNFALRQLERQASERMSRMMMYEGNFELEVPGDVFERAHRLQQQYPVVPETGRVRLDVPVKGNLYDLTVEQAEHLYEMRQHESAVTN
ncbi:MAG: hypothetical protein Q7R22_011600 [Verrucomicrobiota bacterium JB025]|nr:hypothetical protein [Verrucomicrobiota bacterium JB025]